MHDSQKIEYLLRSLSRSPGSGAAGGASGAHAAVAHEPL